MKQWLSTIVINANVFSKLATEYVRYSKTFPIETDDPYRDNAGILWTLVYVMDPHKQWRLMNDNKVWLDQEDWHHDHTIPKEVKLWAIKTIGHYYSHMGRRGWRSDEKEE